VPGLNQVGPRAALTAGGRDTERQDLPMCDQDTPDLAERYDAMERDVLYLLMNGKPIWSVEDIGRDIDDQPGAEDAVRGLRQAGLVNQTSDGFVFATRAGYRMVQIVGKVV